MDDENLPMYPGENTIPWRTSLCLDLVNTFLMSQRASLMLKTYPSRSSSYAAATIKAALARVAVAAPTACAAANVSCTTWGTCCQDAPATSNSPIRSITALTAAITSTPMPQIWRCRGVTTPCAWSPSPCGWWWRMDCPIAPPPGICGATIASSFPSPPCRTGSRREGKKAQAHITTDYLDEALADFSGYIAADELYDGPFCVLSLVDNRRFKRLTYEVLDHNPTHEDIQRFFGRFQAVLAARGLSVRGITTDGSPLYPLPITEVFGGVEHQVCECHVVREISKAVTQARKALVAQMPPLARGRPASKEAKRKARRRQHLQQKVADLFHHRYLFVQHSLTPAEKKTLARISRGHKPLRVLREIMEEVYRLFDRRCRSEAALAKLARLRRRVRRFQQVGQTLQSLFSPNLEKALTFLDDKLLPATSNAVERGNRRHRKMQKTVYRVRTQVNISNRIALDMLRDAQAEGRQHTTQTLHLSRIGA